MPSSAALLIVPDTDNQDPITYIEARTDALAFADAIASGSFGWPEVMAVIASARGFRRELLPEAARPLFDRHTVLVRSNEPPFSQPRLYVVS